VWYGILVNLDGGPRSIMSCQEFTNVLLQICQETVGFATLRQMGKVVTSLWRSEAETEVV
jgi:hypothetical protein